MCWRTATVAIVLGQLMPSTPLAGSLYTGATTASMLVYRCMTLDITFVWHTAEDLMGRHTLSILATWKTHLSNDDACAMCFNAAKTWQIGYNKIVVNPRTAPELSILLELPTLILT